MNHSDSIATPVDPVGIGIIGCGNISEAYLLAAIVLQANPRKIVASRADGEHFEISGDALFRLNPTIANRVFDDGAATLQV